MSGPDQFAFSFDSPDSNADASGLEQWREEQRTELQRSARALGLPLGHRVQLVLKNGIEVEGRLVLANESKRSRDPMLRVANVDFHLHDIESCLSLEE